MEKWAQKKTDDSRRLKVFLAVNQTRNQNTRTKVRPEIEAGDQAQGGLDSLGCLEPRLQCREKSEPGELQEI